MRVLLVAVLIHGLVPALGEAAEAVVHYAAAGHLAHGADDHGDLGDLGREHGCGGAEHRCDCCPSVAFDLAPSSAVAARVESELDLALDAVAPPRARSLEPPLRPPIA